jgi:hypothetical protein
MGQPEDPYSKKCSIIGIYRPGNDSTVELEELKFGFVMKRRSFPLGEGDGG